VAPGPSGEPSLPPGEAGEGGKVPCVAMPLPAEVELPDEAPDVTATEAHNRLMVRLWSAVQAAFGDRALVLLDIFVRVDGRRQAAPDVLVAPPSAIADHRVYAVPAEPAPLVTVEIISETNHSLEGQQALAAKRELFGSIGVPAHIEIDLPGGVVTTWTSRGGELVRTSVADRYDGAALGGVTVEAPAPGAVRVLAPDGREVLDPGVDLAREAARADSEARHAAREAARAEMEAARAERLADRLRQLGVDPDAL
jgi:hypothetical protein